MNNRLRGCFRARFGALGPLPAVIGAPLASNLDYDPE